MAADPHSIAHIVVTTNLACAAGLVGATVTAWIWLGKPDFSITLTGALGGLVAITHNDPAAGSRGPQRFGLRPTVPPSIHGGGPLDKAARVVDGRARPDARSLSSTGLRSYFQFW